ncbi:hypothetical protein AVEN_114686-1 [Araneus ventricosus]|uniref:Uncharacterized protein n=1 Tax=Araneus ventricosus TaxID=182803 RepID=A0A4Y2SPF1_ARAVE|nr:hypothetical protein AVEN_114686-1 [Araneus ventricosus]
MRRKAFTVMRCLYTSRYASLHRSPDSFVFILCDEVLHKRRKALIYMRLAYFLDYTSFIAIHCNVHHNDKVLRLYDARSTDLSSFIHFFIYMSFHRGPDSFPIHCNDKVLRCMDVEALVMRRLYTSHLYVVSSQSRFIVMIKCFVHTTQSFGYASFVCIFFHFMCRFVLGPVQSDFGNDKVSFRLCDITLVMRRLYTSHLWVVFLTLGPDSS